jgi:hypothetical protein
VLNFQRLALNTRVSTFEIVILACHEYVLGHLAPEPVTYLIYSANIRHLSMLSLYHTSGIGNKLFAFHLSYFNE